MDDSYLYKCCRVISNVVAQQAITHDGATWWQRLNTGIPNNYNSKTGITESASRRSTAKEQNAHGSRQLLGTIRHDLRNRNNLSYIRLPCTYLLRINTYMVISNPPSQESQAMPAQPKQQGQASLGSQSRQASQSSIYAHCTARQIKRH